MALPSSCIEPVLPCGLCGGRQATVVGTRSRSGAALRSVACTGCGLVWCDPRPHDARQFYEEDYRLAYKQTFTPRAKHVLRAGRVALDRWRRVQSVLARPGDVLDVGSGGGEFAHLLQTLGHRVVGVEPNRGYAEYSRAQYGLDVRRGFIGEVALPQGAFDVVTIWHVLEHTEDPAAVLRRLHAVLRPGGTLVVEVPNVLATCQSPRSSFHEAHLYTFSPQTLQALGARCGFEAAQVSLSPDGGNVTAVFRRQEGTATAPAALADHHAQVARTIAGHTPWSHALSAHPWRRAAGRLARAAGESLALAFSGGRTGRALLDPLYARALAGARSGAARPRTHRGWIAGAYALAVLAEELLLDQVLPLGQMGQAERVALYAALQFAVIGGLLWAFGQRPRSGRELLQVGGWAVPLFAVPAVC